MKIFKNFNQKINYKFQNFNFNNKKIYNNNNNKINIKYNKNKFRICNKKINKKSLILNIYNFNIKN